MDNGQEKVLELFQQLSPEAQERIIEHLKELLLLQQSPLDGQ